MYTIVFVWNMEMAGVDVISTGDALSPELVSRIPFNILTSKENNWPIV